jgi:hypothetical protein
MPSTDAVCNDLNHNSFLPSRRSLASVCVRFGFSDRSMRVPRTTSLPRISQSLDRSRGDNTHQWMKYGCEKFFLMPNCW